MAKLALLVVVVLACHSSGEPVQHPAGAQQQVAAQPVGSPEPTRPAVARSGVDAPGGQSDASDDSARSAKRWVYASFFNRLKRKVAQNWDPESVLRRIDPTGTVYGAKTHHTELRVRLSRDGTITSLLATVPSGITELDDEALRAFRVAAPFGPMPDGLDALVDKDGQITFPFSFDFDAGTKRMTWRMPAGN